MTFYHRSKTQLVRLSLLCALTSPVYGQERQQDGLYVAVYTFGKNWGQDKKAHEQEYHEAHSSYLKKLREAGSIVMGGRYGDKELLVLKAESLVEAMLVTQQDSAVKFHTFQVSVYPFNALYPGYVGTSEKDLKEEKARVIGLGGFFFKSEDPEKLRKWYKDKLGIEGGDQGTSFELRKVDDPNEPGFTVWHAFGKTDDYFNVGTQEYMINYRVNDLLGLLAELRKKKVKIVGEPETYEYGTFAWILDLEGRKIELWQADDKVYDRITAQRMDSN